LKEAEVSTKEMIKSATKSIDIFTHVFNWYDDVEDELIAATKRGCKVRVILKNEQSNINLVKLKSIGIEFKLIDKERVKTRGTIVDESKVIFVIWATEGVEEVRRIYRPQFSYNEGIVEVFSHFFEFLWKSN
jgi:sugar-specific transcriptional regulator TrmB